MVEKLFNMIDDRFKLGTIVKGPGYLRFFGINIIQNETFSIETNADDKLEVLESDSISRYRRQKSLSPFLQLNRTLSQQSMRQ